MNPVRAIGRSTLDLLQTAGAVALFALRGVLALVTPRWFLGQTGRQILAIGYFSLPVLIGDKIVAVVDLKTDRAQQKLLVQQWTWIEAGSKRARKKQIEDALHRFEHFQLAR